MRRPAAPNGACRSAAMAWGQDRSAGAPRAVPTTIPMTPTTTAAVRGRVRMAATS